MAQWDHRDPRWLVSDMGSGGSNVNGWHWEEKSKIAWSKNRLAELIQSCGAKYKDEKGYAQVTGLSNLTGEAYLTRRKGNKTLAVYDLTVTLSWEGQLRDEDKKVSGTVVISEFCLGADAEDYLFSATSDGSDDKHDCLLKGLRSVKNDIYEVLQRFDEEIKGLPE